MWNFKKWRGGCCLLLLFITGALNAQVTKEDYRRIDTLYKLSDRVYNRELRPDWIGESNYFCYLNHERGGDIFYLVQAETGKKEKAFDAEKLAKTLSLLSGRKINPASLPFTRLKFAPDRKSFEFNFNEKTWIYSIKNDKLKEKTIDNHEKENKEEAETKVISPDKKWEASLKNFNLIIRDIERDEEFVLSRDGVKDFYYTSDIEWSPDSKKIAIIQVKDRQERRIPLIESSPKNQTQPVLQWLDYPKPGDIVPLYLPALFDVVNKKQIPLKVSPYENQFYLNQTGWRKDSRAFTFEYNQRGHQRYIVAEVSAEDGKIRTLIDEQSPTFIHYGRNFRHDLKDGREILWISERDGWRHLYLIDGVNGKVKNQITTGDWVVRDVLHVDEEKGELLFTASGFNSGEDPYNIHYCRIRIDGSGFMDLTPENGNHNATFSSDRKYFTDAYSRPDMPPVSVIRRTSDGRITAELEKCDIRDISALGWQMPEVFAAKGRDGKTAIWGNIWKPMNIDLSASYPIIEMIYAGPHDSHVDKDFKAYNYLASRLCNLGFVVVMIDGMGTANRSKAFHDVCWKNLKDAGFPDRISWIKAAAGKFAYMDTTRVGIYGWSAGGQNALAALLFHHDFYKAAVALCGCHDNRMDKIWWNEQWMGYPLDESYSASSNVDNAALLQGKLLLINGELDNNVDPASTLQVVNALVNANKNFEQLYLPNRGHSLGGTYEMHRIHDFFVKNLLNQNVPEWE